MTELCVQHLGFTFLAHPVGIGQTGTLKLTIGLGLILVKSDMFFSRTAIILETPFADFDLRITKCTYLILQFLHVSQDFRI